MNAETLVAMSFIGIDACNPIKGVYGASQTARTLWRTLGAYLQREADTRSSDKGIQDLFRTVQLLALYTRH